MYNLKLKMNEEESIMYNLKLKMNEEESIIFVDGVHDLEFWRL